MGNLFTSFIMEAIGAFFAWAYHGFKGKYTDEFSKPHENSKKSTRNTIISIVFVLIVVWLLQSG